MKIRAFKTYSKSNGYYAINFLPTINVDYFVKGEKQISISWLVWAVQVKWDIINS